MFIKKNVRLMLGLSHFFVYTHCFTTSCEFLCFFCIFFLKTFHFFDDNRMERWYVPELCWNFVLNIEWLLCVQYIKCNRQKRKYTKYKDIARNIERKTCLCVAFVYFFFTLYAGNHNFWNWVHTDFEYVFLFHLKSGSPLQFTDCK